MKLSVIIPVYNEKKTILQVIGKVSALSVPKEIIVVDDCSHDGSYELLIEEQRKNNAFKLIRQPSNSGKGYCIRKAMELASGEYTIIQDADLEQSPSDILKLLETALTDGTKAVFGTRVLNWGHEFDIRYIANKVFALVTDLLFKTHISDIMTGYKLIKTDILKSLQIRCNSFDIEPELTALLLKKGIQIREIPVSYHPRGYKEGKKIRAAHGFLILWCLFRVRFQKP